MFYTYALIDPINRLPFYIGKGKGDRSHAHLKGHAQYNEDKLRTINNIRLLEHEPEVVFIKKDMTSKQALELESFIIQKCKEQGITLTNRDSFPPDRTGSVLSEKHIQRLREFNQGKVLTDEHKKKIGMSNSYKPNFDQSKNAEYADKSLKRNEGSKNPRAQQISVNGIVFNCKKHAHEYFGVTRETFEKHFIYSKL